MAYNQPSSPFTKKQKGGGTTKTCLPYSKIKNMSKEHKDKSLLMLKNHQEQKVNIKDRLKQMLKAQEKKVLH